jgi:hypothetical protein
VFRTLKLVTKNNYNTLTEIHTTKITVTTAHIMSLVATSTADVPLTLVSRTVPGLSYERLTSRNCNCQLTQLRVRVRVTLRLAVYQSQSRSYVTTDGQSSSLSWNKAPTWGSRPYLPYCQRVAGLLMWGALSDERTGLSFVRVTVSSNKSVVSLYNLHFTC